MDNQTKKIKVFVDLDDTLIKTSYLKEEMIRIIADMGVPVEVAKERYEQSKDGNGIPVLSTIVNSFADYNIDPNYLRGRLETMYGTIAEVNLYTERMIWLEDKYPRETHEYILLTRGEKNVQERKMRNFNLQALFDRVIIVQTGKAEALRSLVVHGERFVVVDDKRSELSAIEKQYPNEAQLLISPAEGDPQPYFKNKEQEPSRREG